MYSSDEWAMQTVWCVPHCGPVRSLIIPSSSIFPPQGEGEQTIFVGNLSCARAIFFSYILPHKAERMERNGL